MGGWIGLRCWAVIAWLQAGSCLHAQTVTLIREAGPRENRLNVVLLSEGYTTGELGTKFAADAQNVVEGLLASEPYKEYRDYFNFFIIAVASSESGSDHPSRGIWRNTYFNSSFDSHGLSHMLTIPPNNYIASYAEGQGKVDQLLMQFVPDYDLAIVVVNDEQYGGVTTGRTSVVSMNVHAQEVAQHELAHTLADLGDEYESPGPPDTRPVERPNVTQQTQRDGIKWRSWIMPKTPVPTPETAAYEEVIGLFEGANYNSTGWFRPRFNCKMNSATLPFCEVCSEALTLHLNARVSTIDDPTPEGRDLILYSGESTTFRIRRLKPATHELVAQWYVDNVAVQGASGDEFTFSAIDAAPGKHVVRVEVSDRSPLVRNDFLRAMSRSEEWTVNVNDTPPPSAAPVLNVSTRLPVQTGEGVLIGGFILTGTEPKRVIIRGIGPSLGPGLGVPTVTLTDVLGDPVLELLDGAGAVLAANDNWRDTQEQEVRETTIQPHHSLESAIVMTLPPGAYTAKVAGKGGTSGVGLVEVYDVQRNTTATLANISTRGAVKTGDDVMIGGFIVGPAAVGQTRVAVRSLGPSLQAAGVADALLDPRLELRGENGEVLGANDDWKDSQQTEIADAGLAPGDDREAAIVATLPSGAYTAIVAGKNATTGVGLFELYDVGE